MNLLNNLVTTYDHCFGQYVGEDALTPSGHIQKYTQINVVLSASSEFIRASVSKEYTIIPCTEDSRSRTTNVASHPLCEKIQYCGQDYPNFSDDAKKASKCFADYQRLMSEWLAFDPQPKLAAIKTYIDKGTVTADLIAAGILFAGTDNKLLTKWEGEELPLIFKLLTPDPKTKEYTQGDATIRWSVISDSDDDMSTNVWTDQDMQHSWIKFIVQSNESVDKGLCMVTGKVDVIRGTHPRFLRNPGDNAKLISSNDNAAYTFRGRFNKAIQVASIGSDATEKAHAALKWLIQRQGFKNEDETIVAWNTFGKPVASFFCDTDDLLPEEKKGLDLTDQAFGLELKKALQGYGQPSTHGTTVVAAFDSASPGRLALTFYQEYNGSEYQDRIAAWHSNYAWYQDYPGKFGKRFIGTPSLRDIAEAAYGAKGIPPNTLKRLLPCVMEGMPVPKDIVSACVRRVCKPNLEHWEFRKYLGIACSLVKGNAKGNYNMTLDPTNTNRGYLFGRLLAIAERFEQAAQYSRDKEKNTGKTHAERQMSRFAMVPASAWKTIETSLVPYRHKLRANNPGLLVMFDNMIDEIIGLFPPDGFTNQKLNEEFVLGYHLQRKALWEKKQEDNKEEKGVTK